MPDIRYVRTYDRADFIQLMANIAYAISSGHLQDKQNPPVIAIHGTAGSGKSLAAEALFKSWMDTYSHADVLTIPRDNKMFMEDYPMHSIGTVSRMAPIAGTEFRFSFNSDVMHHKEDIDDTLARTFERSTTPNLLVLSNTDRNYYYTRPDHPVWMEINMNAPSFGKEMFYRDINITVFKDALLDDPQFRAYWDRLEDLFTHDPARERDILRPKNAIPPLPGKITL